jgi:hypothetical protein
MVGVLCVAVICVLFGRWVRGQAAFASTLSQRFGASIRWWELPRMRSKMFDAWCLKRSLKTSE